jgi:hypothetical protein
LRAEPLAAQTPSGVVGRVELSASAAWIGAVGYSTADANELDRDGNPFRLFRTEGEMAPTVSYGARFSVRLSDMFELETSASYATPELIVRVSDDFEDAEAAEVSEILHQIRVEGGILQYMRRPEPGRRNLPFVVLGAAFLRDLHEDQTLAENGQEYFVGAGLKYAFLSRAGASLRRAVCGWTHVR